MSLPATHTQLADAHSPLPPGPENRVQVLALLLRLSAGIALLPAILLLLVLPRALRARRAPGAWYLSDSDQAGIDALSPRARHAVGRVLAIIGWALAGHRNRGMRPHARPHATEASARHPISGPRAPPCPA